MARYLLLLVAIAAVLPLAGCSSSGGDDFDPKKIAVKQPGDGPPPMTPPGAQQK